MYGAKIYKKYNTFYTFTGSVTVSHPEVDSVIQVGSFYT